MQFEITNKDIERLYNELYSLNISIMKANRGRVKFLKKLEEKYKDFMEFKNAIFDEYLQKENDEYLVVDDKYIVKDGKEQQFNSDMNELLNEKIVISSGEYSNRFFDFFIVLQNYEGNIENIYLIDDILEQFEKQQEDK